MASSSNSKRCRIVGTGILCVILVSSPAFAAPGIGEGSDSPTLGTLIRETITDFFSWVSNFGDPSQRQLLRLKPESRQSGLPSPPSDGGDVDAQDGVGPGGGDPGPVGG